MWRDSALCQLLGITLPLIEAPMAGRATTAAFVAAASNAGALGSIGAGYMTPDALRKMIKAVRALTNKPFAVNLFIPNAATATPAQLATAKTCIEQACPELSLSLRSITPPYVPSFDEQLAVVVEEQVPVFSFTFGVPALHWINKLKSRGIRLIGTATTLAEGKYLADAEIDVIVAQGKEAGGHRGSFLAPVEESLVHVSELVTQLVSAQSAPVVAAGGLMDAKDIMHVLSLGALGVQLGTAFLCSPESGISVNYKNRLLNLKHDETTLTRAFSGKWARGIRNKFIERMQDQSQHILDYPIQHALTQEMRQVAEQSGEIDFMSLWAGQAAFKSEGLPVSDLIQKLDAALRRF